MWVRCRIHNPTFVAQRTAFEAVVVQMMYTITLASKASAVGIHTTGLMGQAAQVGHGIGKEGKVQARLTHPRFARAAAS